MVLHFSKKMGKLAVSHRYNFTPLLRSRPGGLKGAGRTELTQRKSSFFMCLNKYFNETPKKLFYFYL
jgi:hypothetical protein